ncbi:MAG TPA: class I SAM-dependent methyltransferase [Candidatus Paceibacterota bacterium]
MNDALRPEVQFFNDTSVSYRKEYDRQTPEGYSFRVRREKVLAMVPENSKVLDIACGPGVMIPGFRSKHCLITCTDAAPEMIARIKDEYGEVSDLTAVVGDAYALPFESYTYDVATAMGLIEYLEDQGTFLGEAHRVLRQGGILIITFPNYHSPWRAANRFLVALKRLLGQKSSGTVMHREYTARRAMELLTDHGFDVEDVLYYNFKLIPYPLDRKLARFTVMQSRIFEHLDRGPLKWLGTAFIIRATKR